MPVKEKKGTNILDKIKAKARVKKRTVVLPEGLEPRVIKAAAAIIKEKIAQVILLGNKDEIAALARKNGLKPDAVQIMDPATSELLPSFASEFYELRKEKGMTEQEALETMKQYLYFGAMLVRRGMAYGSVAGSINTTGDVLRAGIQVIGLAPGIKTVSGAFMMTVPKYRDKINKIYMYADSAVVPNPDPEQLASIAVSTAETMKNLTGEDPKVAMLSFSTKGSAKHPDVDKVTAALAILRKNYPELKVDGEFQVDAAIVPEVARSKAPGSAIAGKANVLIFPDLDAGNIAYKLTQRLANATATGPIVQGLAKPCNDLSRGCSWQDIVDVAAIAMLMKG
jgi:phosphate acetyltransferase